MKSRPKTIPKSSCKAVKAARSLLATRLRIGKRFLHLSRQQSKSLPAKPKPMRDLWENYNFPSVWFPEKFLKRK